MIKEHPLSQRRAFRLLNRSRSYYKRKNQNFNEELKKEMETLCSKYRSYGFSRIFHLIKRKGYKVNPKRIKRIYRLEGWSLRRKRRRREKRAAFPQTFFHACLHLFQNQESILHVFLEFSLLTQRLGYNRKTKVFKKI